MDDAAVLATSLATPECFSELFDRYHGAIWRYVNRRGGSDRADEIASETFVVAFRQRATFDPDRGTVRAWLYGIATNLLKMKLRSDGRGARAFERVAGLRSTDDAFEDAIEHRDALAGVLRALAELPAVDREIITLHVWDELAYDEIAAVLEIPLGTVRSRLSRARDRLRERAGLSGKSTDQAS